MTLDELKAKIEAVPPRPDENVPDDAYEDWLSEWRAHNACLAKAWRAAFEWRNGIVESPVTAEAWAERNEGMKLIRERLS